MGFLLELDGKNIQSANAFHKAVTEASGIGWYGQNLNALWDLLTGLVERPVSIRWVNARLSAMAMGEDYTRIVGVIVEAVTEFNDDDIQSELVN
jgi:ribonuclease inhibitor